MNPVLFLIRRALVALVVLGPLAVSTGAASAKPVTLAYIANAGNNHVQILDVETGQTVNKLYTGGAPWRLIESPDGKRLAIQNWYSETTAIVNTATNMIETVLPVRGPGAFSPKGDKFWTYSWPGSFLQAFDGKTFAPLEQRQTEDRSVYEMVFWGKDRVYLGQYDPMSKVGRQVYDYVLAAKLNDPKHLSASISTGSSPAKLVPDPTGEFLLAANFDDRSVSIVNKNGATAQISLAAGPRDILFVRGGKRMIVVSWKPGSAMSQLFTLHTDFKARPWPTVKADRTIQVDAGLVAAAVGPGGRTFYALDRPGKRLITFDSETLKEVGSIPVGDEPTTFLIRQVSARERNRLVQKPEGRKRLEAVIDVMKTRGAPFQDVRFTETMTSEVTSAPSGDDTKEGAKPETKTVTSTIKTAMKLPDSVRQEFGDGGVRLAQGGRAMLITKEGRFQDTPRQDLVYLLYTIYGLSTEEAVRQLAGDVPGSPYLRNGLAVDIVRTVEEEGHRYHAIGALDDHEMVSQLWVSAETGLPMSLVEQFPIMRPKNPHSRDEGFSGMTETKLHYQKVDGGFTIPVKLSRYLDGKEVGVVEMSQIAFNQHPPADQFDLAKLGGVLKSPPQKLGASTAVQTPGPGVAVASLGNEHIETPFAEHAPYNSNPPTSGPHTPYLANWGSHRIPIAPETQVHNLEDGGVLIQYACPTPCPDLIKQLEGMVFKHERVIVAPYPLMDHRVALTAWGRLETLSEFDEARISAFIEAYAGKDHHPAEGEPKAKPEKENG